MSTPPPSKRFKPTSPSPPPSTEAGPSTITPIAQAPLNAMYVPPTKREMRKKRKQKRPLPEPYSPAEIMWHDVRDFLGHAWVDEVVSGDQDEWVPPKGLERMEVREVRVGAFTVSGESLSLWEEDGIKWAIVVPFAHPGDLIRCKIYKHDRLHTYADLVEILEYSETYRGGEGDRRKFPDQGCKYFGDCGGCQLQPMPYALQLAHKKKTVELAYERFSGLSRDLWPDVRDTIGSPKQWGYRTKITPHFDAPPKWAQPKKVHTNGIKPGHAEEQATNGSFDADIPKTESGERTWECRIGFDRKGRPGVLDIEECPIATPVLNTELKQSRETVQSTIMNYKKGATLILRDSLPPSEPNHPFSPTDPLIPEEEHIAITNHHESVYERVGNFLFSFSAGSFFQNNNSILVPLTEYVREAIFPLGEETKSKPKPTHLVDAYCGSGLFGITLSPFFDQVAGVEISSASISAAKLNAEINGEKVVGKTSWLCGKAEEIFGDLPGAGFEGGRSCVVVDPPRKGCDQPFLTQLLDFKPLTIVYVSCNVHTQARDVGWFVRAAKARGVEYKVESLRGFDLFPQTAHVESVAVLRLDTPSA